MISRAHLEKVRGYIGLGSEEGATLLCGGLEPPELPVSLRVGNFVRRRSSPTSTTGCGSPRRRSSARSRA